MVVMFKCFLFVWMVVLVGELRMFFYFFFMVKNILIIMWVRVKCYRFLGIRVGKFEDSMVGGWDQYGFC